MYTAHGKNEDKDQLLSQHAGLVKKIGCQLKAKLPASVELDDLIQAGMMGLLDAVNRFEDDHGAQFVTYASQRIRGAMLDELRSADWLPRSVRKNMRDVGPVQQNESLVRADKSPPSMQVRVRGQGRPRSRWAHARTR